MATYEYRCASCGRQFEVTRPMSQADAPATCPQCGGPGQKLISGFASTVGYGVKGLEKPPFRGKPDQESKT